MPTVQASLRLTFKYVLLPTDFTGASVAALAYARALAKDYGSKIFVTHAVTPNPPVFLPMEPIPVDLDAEWHDAQSQLEQFLRLDTFDDTTHEGILERGELWNVLDDVIHRHSIDLNCAGEPRQAGTEEAGSRLRGRTDLPKSELPGPDRGTESRPARRQCRCLQAHYLRDRLLGWIVGGASLCPFAGRGEPGPPDLAARHPTSADAASGIWSFGSEETIGRTDSTRRGKLVPSGYCRQL
jgi:Universal stress protein family